MQLTQKQSTYLPQTRRTSMLQAAAARLTVPLQRIRCMTCRYQHHCQLMAPCKYKCSLELKLMHTLSKGTQQVALLITCRLIIRRQVITSNIVLSGLLTSDIEMLAAIHTNTHRDCETSVGYYPLHYHCVTAAYLCLHKRIRHGCCDLQQHSRQVVIGLFACGH